MNPEKIIVPENKNQLPDIPKSKEIYSGDINDAVITVQKVTGYEITPEWWARYVGNDGSTEEILERFDAAFERFVREQITGVSMDEQEENPSDNKQLALREADEEYDKFNEQFKDDPEYNKLSKEFLEALKVHLMNKYFPEEIDEGTKKEAAWTYYAALGSEEYEAANNERIKDGKIKVITVGDVTLVASINVDASGNVISGHDYNPDSTSMQETEAAFTDYIAQTSPDERLVVYEGDERLFSDKREAIEKATDSGLAQYLAHEAGTPTRRGEPTIEEEYQAMLARGVTKDEFIALDVVRGIQAALTTDEAHAISGKIYQSAAQIGLENFTFYTDEQKRAIQAAGKVEEVMADIETKAATLVPMLNNSYRETLGQDLFVVKDNQVVLNPNFNKENVANTIIDKLTMTGDGRLNEVSRLDMEVRDRFIFDRIIVAIQDGKKSFVPYGGSHIVTLEPALRAYFEE